MFLRWMTGHTGFYLNVYIVVVVTCHTLMSRITGALVGSVLTDFMCCVLDCLMAIKAHDSGVTDLF